MMNKRIDTSQKRANLARYRKALCLILILCMTAMCLTGCGKNKKKTVYKQYVQDLLDVNYKGIFDGYYKNEKGTESSAVSMHHDCVRNLSLQLISHYSLENYKSVSVNDAFAETATSIYSKADYSVSEAYRDDGKYYVDVTIKPMDILNQSYDDIMGYIDMFNEMVKDGLYNDYTEAEYEEEFAFGISNTLLGYSRVMEYKDPVVVKALIEDDGDYFSISPESLKEIDAAMIALEESK